MTRTLITLTVLLALAMPVRAQSGEAIQDVISSQIEAFLSDDVGTAFTFASPTIKRMFGTPERFGAMVQSGYPMVWRPADVSFRGVRQVGERQVQTVVITDETGRIHVLEYSMIESADGWQIDGVRIIREPQLGA